MPKSIDQGVVWNHFATREKYHANYIMWERDTSTYSEYVCTNQKPAQEPESVAGGVIILWTRQAMGETLVLSGEAS